MTTRNAIKSPPPSSSTTQLRDGKAPGRGDPRARRNSAGYFTHHGVWAPGIRLFRALSFTPKAALISGVLLIPLAVVFFVYLQKEFEDLDFARTELQGVTALKAFVPLLRASIDLRDSSRAALGAPGAGMSVSEARSGVDKAMGDFDAFLATSGDPLHFADSFAKLKKTYEEGKSAGGAGSADGQAPWAGLTEVARQIEEDLADKSNLSLDPDASSYYLQLVVTGEVSLVAESLGQMRGYSVYLNAKGGGSPKDERAFAIWDSRVSEHAAVIRDDLSRAITADPTLSINLTPLELVEDYQKASTRAVIDHAGGDPKGLWNDGSAALDALFGVYAQSLPMLAGILQARIDGMVHQRTLLLAVFGISLAVAVYLFYCFYRVMQGGLDEVRRHLQAMTAGDLTTVARPWGRDEVASLMLSLTHMQDSLRAVAGQVRNSADAIVHASDEIASASRELSDRSERAAADLEEDAASIEQVSAAIRNTAEHAVNAASLAQGNSSSAQRGSKVFGEVVSTMQELHGSSSKIRDIIGTIDGIAFQTNILALNAAVEAARAGDQGRGFAVVATEVRNLAQRSAQAAREIKGLITGSVEQVEDGTRVVSGAGTTMHELVDNAQRMNDLLGEISRAATEQSNGVRQVGTSIQELDQMTQQNAALVEQTAAAAQNLREQSQELVKAVAVFKLSPETA